MLVCGRLLLFFVGGGGRMLLIDLYWTKSFIRNNPVIVKMDAVFFLFSVTIIFNLMA